MTDAFGLPIEGEEPECILESLIAAGQWSSGGNSTLARRLRVAMQRRDRYGRWAEMGGGISFKGRLGGGVVTFIGRYVGPAERDNYLRVYIGEDQNGAKKGIYEVPSKVATVAKAIIGEEDLAEAGVKLDVNSKRVGEVLDRDIEPIEDMFKGAPNEADQDIIDNAELNADEQAVQDANRKKAPSYKSYNVVDKKGNPVSKEDQGKPEASDEFPGPYVAGNPTDEQLLWARRNIHSQLGVPEAGFYPDKKFEDLQEMWDEINREPNLTEAQRNARRAPIRSQLLIDGQFDRDPRSRDKALTALLDNRFEPQPLRPPVEEALPPVEPKADAAAQKLVKDVSNGDVLIDTTGFAEPALQHVGGVITSKSYDTVNGTATFEVTTRSGEKVSLVRRIDGVVGISPRESREGGTRLSRSGNAAYQEWLNNQRRANVPPQTESPQPQGPEDGGGPRPPSDGGNGGGGGDGSEPPSGGGDDTSPTPSDSEKFDVVLEVGDDGVVRLVEPVAGESDSTFPDLISEHDKLDGVNLPPKARKALDNLLEYRKKALAKMKRAAVARDEETYERNYAIASTTTRAINQLVDAHLNGDVMTAPFFRGDEASRIDNMRILKSSVVTGTVAQGDASDLPVGSTFIQKADAIAIAKDGMPFFLKFRNASGVYAYTLDANGLPEHMISSLGVSELGGTATGRNNDLFDAPNYASIGMIKTHVKGHRRYDLNNGAVETQQNNGLAGFTILMARWASQRSSRRFSHSPTLYAPGNFYSKMVSLNMFDHSRTQREKFIFERYGRMNHPLFKVMDAQGLLSDSFKKPLTITTQEGGANESPMWNMFASQFSDTSGKLPRKIRQLFKDNPDAIPGVDYPDIFEDHVKSPQGDVSKFDVQTILLQTTFKDGDTRDEAVAKLRALEDSLARWEAQLTESQRADALGGALRLISTERQKLTSFVDAFEKVDFPDDFRVEQNKGLEDDKVKFFDSPFAGTSGFTQFDAPSGVRAVPVGPDFDFRTIVPDGQPEDWTELPSLLAGRFSTEELVRGLRDAVLTSKDGRIVSISRDGKNYEVQGGSVYRALMDQGADAADILAKIYDEARGDNANSDKLSKFREQLRPIQEDIDKLRAQFGELAPAVDFNVIGGNYEEVNGIAFADPVVRRAGDDVPTAQKLRPIVENTNFILGAAGRGSNIYDSQRPYAPQLTAEDWVFDGITDDPRIIARNFSPRTLKNALMDSIRGRKRLVKLQFANGSQRDVAIDAIRDALQHQGVDVQGYITADRSLNFTVPKNTLSQLGVETLRDGTTVAKYSIGEGGTQLSIGVKTDAPGQQVIVGMLDSDFREHSVGAITFENGQYFVSYRSPSKRDGSRPFGAVDGDADQVPFATLGEAALNLRVALIDDLNANNNSTGFFPTLNALVKLATRDEVNSFGKGEIALLEPRRDFVQPEPGERDNIRFVARATYGRAGRLGSQKILLTEYNEPEETDLVTRTTLFDGTVVVDQFGKVSTRDDGLFSYQNNATGEVKLYENRDAAVLAMGRDYAVANGHKNIVISDEKVLEEYDRELAQKGVSAEDFVVNDSADERVGVAPAKLADGAIGEVSITLNKRNPGVYRQNDPYHVLASFEIKPSSPDGAINNAPVISGSVQRTGRGTWTVEINQPGQPRIRQTFRPNDQQANAVTYMAEKLILNYGLDVAAVSDILRVNRPLQARPARGPDVTAPSNALPADQILQPENMPVNAERVQNVLDRVQNQMVTFPVSLVAVDRNDPRTFNELNAAGYFQGPRLGGAGGAFSLVLPDGRTVKIKTNSRIDPANRGRKNRMEALVHHLFDMGGIITTGGGLGQDSDGTTVMAEVLEPRTVNGNPWRTMPQLDPAYEKAREDLRRARVFEAWFNEEDSMENSGNHLLIRDKNGDFRVVICDGGGMLKFGALHLGENGGFTRDHVRDYLSRRAKFAGLIEAFDAGRLDEPISFTGGTMTPRQFQQILRERVLPFTPDLIRRAVSGSLTNTEDIRDTADNLIRRRTEMLELFGIPDVHANNQNNANPNVSAPAGGDGGGGGTPPSGGGNGGDGGGGPSSSTTPPNFPPDSSIVEFEKEDGGPAGRLAVRSTGPDAREVFDEDGRVVGKTFKRSNGDHVVVMNPDDADRPEGVRLVAHVFDGSNPLARTGAMNMLSALATRASGGNIDGTQINLFDPTGDRLDANLFDIGERAKENGRKYENVGAFVDQQARTVSESTRNTVVDLIRSKEMPSAERRSLNDLLATPELLGGEAVYVERQIRAYPDRAGSDIARSDAANANNAGDARQPSDLDNAQPARDNVLVTVDKLVAGDVVDGLGRVAFVSDAGEGRVAVGYIPNAGGPLRVIQIPSTSAVRRVTNPEGQGTDLPGGNNNVARFRQEGNETINDVKRAYPNHRVLPNGDLVVATRTYTEARGNKFLYEVVVHRNGTEEFVAYARRVRLDANNNPIPGTEEAAGRTHYAHSSQALLNRVPALINNGNRGIMAPAPGRWFTQLGDRKPEVIDPRTGQLIHPDVLPNRHGNFIGDTGIEKTGNGVKDALISYIAELVDRGVDTRDIIARMTRQRVLDNNQLMDVIERIEAARRFPGINAVPYVGKDRNTIVRVGDVVDHFDFEGNLIKRGGVVKSRRRLVVYDKVQGRYEYRDILYVQFPGRRGQTPIAARRLQPTQRGDGSPVRTIADEAGGVAPIVPSRVEVVEPINMRDGGGENVPVPSGYQVVVRDNGTTIIRENGNASPTKAYALIQPPGRRAGEKFRASVYDINEMGPNDSEEFDSYQEAQDWAINSINEINAGAGDGGANARQPGDQTDVGIAGYVEEFGDGFVNWIAPPGFKQMRMDERRRLGKPYGFYSVNPDRDGMYIADFFDANGRQRGQNFASKEEARQYLLDSINDVVGDGFQIGEGIPSGFREVTLIADMYMVRGTIDGEDAYSTYSLTPNGTGGGYDYGFYKSGVRLGGGTKPSIAEARQAGIDLITELIDAPVAGQQGNGGVGAPDNFINRLPAGYRADFFGDSVIAHGEDPRQPAAVWDASNGDVFYFSTYQRYVERGFDGADESEMGVFNRADFDNKAVEHINLAQQENLPVIQLNDAFKRVLTDREITAQLPAGYQNESRALEGFDGPATIFFNPNDPNAKAVAIDRDNGEVRIYGSYQQILDNDGARRIYEGLYDPMRAQVKVIQLIDRDALYRAPAAEQQGGGQSNVAGALPEGYERNTSAGGRLVEIKGADSKPYGYANRTANGWEATNWDSFSDYLAGASPKITQHPDLDSALQDVIEQINLANQRNNPPVAPIPDGYELNDIDGTLPMFEVQRANDTASGGYVLAEQVADGRWQAQSWASKSDAERRRFQRPDSSESFDTREEAVAWAGTNVGAPNANGNSTGLSDAEVQAEMALMNLGDADMIRNVFPNGNYNNRVRRMAALHKKFREMPYEVESGLQTGQGSGINDIQRIRFQDGTYAYLKASPEQALMHEVAAGFLLEAVGVNPNEDWIAARVKNEFGEDRVLMDHRENRGQGRTFAGNAGALKNAREIGLFDYLFENGDRHPGNWLFNDTTAIPIDHGFIMFGAPAYGVFQKMVQRFRDGETDFQTLFTKNELITIKTRLRALGLLFNGMQMEQERRGQSRSDYEQKLEDALNMLDELIGVAR